MIDALIALYRAYPLLGILVETGIVLLLTTLLGRGVLSVLRNSSKRLAAGPVLLASALVVALAFAGVLAYAAGTGRSFEQLVLEWLTGIAKAPIEDLGTLRHPFVLGFTYAALYAAFTTVAMLLAWFLGLLRGDGGAARELEAELGTSWVEQFYKLVGFREPAVQETRFSEWNRPLLKALRALQWIALGGAVTGSLSPPLWALGAIVVEGLALNLVDPAKAPEEERRKKAGTETETQFKDPAQLVRALSIDPRGPELDVREGGYLQGKPEHVAAQTRVAEESTLMRSALEQLEISGLYVHQEAASENVLAARHVLMETPPLSGRRTLGDLLAMRAVLLQGGSVLYLSPDARESARRARAFRELAARCNWAWALHSHDLAAEGRRGVHPEQRPPAIVFATPAELHGDLCPRHQEWSGFLSRLGLVVAVDLDRYGGTTAAALAFTLRRLLRLARQEGAEPVVLSTIAPLGPDMLGVAERLVGVPLHVVGPESDSRGVPPRQVIVGVPRRQGELHPAVGARGVAIACGYKAELSGFEATLSQFEREQQVNRVLLDFGHAVIQTADDGHLQLDSADAVVTEVRPETAALLEFFSRHAGRKAIELQTHMAREVVSRRGKEEEARFAGFSVDDAEGQEAGPAAISDAEKGDSEEAEEEAPAVEIRADRVVNIWLPDHDPFSHLLSQHPEWLDSQRPHSGLALGSTLVLALDLPELADRHARLAASEAPLSLSELKRLFPAALPSLQAPSASLQSRPVARLAADGRVENDTLLSASAAEASAEALTASGQAGRLLDRADGSELWHTDARRLRSAAYPGRVMTLEGRRYRVLLPEEQPPESEGEIYAVPERRRTRTAPVRSIEFTFEGTGHELDFAGTDAVRVHHPAAHVRETVFGVRSSHAARGTVDELSYSSPIVVEHDTRVAVVQFQTAEPSALHGLVHLVRPTLRAFVRHEEEDLDVCFLGEEKQLCFVDRHPGEAGFARAVTPAIVHHCLLWSRQILQHTRHDPECETHDGCLACVLGVPCRSLRSCPRPSRRATSELLRRVLGEVREFSGHS
ncbi:MAG: Zn-binding domain-containing protein [Polyangiaceae bacterium]